MEKHYLEQEAERYIKEREDELKYPVKDYNQKKVTLYHGTSTKYLDELTLHGKILCLLAWKKELHGSKKICLITRLLTQIV